MRLLFLCLFIIALSVKADLYSQQVPDRAYDPLIANPEYSPGSGPIVYIDKAHHNFHTRSGGYLPFSILLERDGYRVRDFNKKLSISTLKNIDILVIANALNRKNVSRWFKPVLPAFTSEEVESARIWVEQGGSLFLIADHMPMGGAAKSLAAAFGFAFTDGFAMDTTQQGPLFFNRTDKTLIGCSISDGQTEDEKVDRVATFTGQAFTIPEEATSILTFDESCLLLESDTAWVFDNSTTFTPIKGWSQGAYMTYGKGRIVVFGEAAMFTAQLAGPNQFKAGMNSEAADQNYKLLLNIIHWLDRKY